MNRVFEVIQTLNLRKNSYKKLFVTLLSKLSHLMKDARPVDPGQWIVRIEPLRRLERLEGGRVPSGVRERDTQVLTTSRAGRIGRDGGRTVGG